MGNIELLILSIGAVVFFTLLLVTGNTMASSVRERVPELAVLKAIGYSDLGVLALVLAEAITIAAVGGGLGLVAAKLLSYHGDPTGGLLSVFYMPNPWLALGFFLALAVGFARGWSGAHGQASERDRRPAPGLKMSTIPFAYNLESLRTRWLSALVAVLGIAGTVAVFIAMLALPRASARPW